MCFYNLNAQNLIINEVMSNPLGNESGIGSPGDRNEYIEIYNSSNQPLNLGDYLISDGDAVDRFKIWDDTNLIAQNVVVGTLIIPPEGYVLVLDPEYTDTGDGVNYQPYYFGDSAVVVTVTNTTLGNGLSGSDPVMLIDSITFDTVSTYGTPQDTADSIPYDPGDGISVERINPLAPDREDNWNSCADSCTPGYRNSSYVCSIHIPPDRIEFRGLLEPGGNCEVKVEVVNLTQELIYNLTLQFYHSVYLSEPESLNLITNSVIPGPIMPQGGVDSTVINWFNLPPGIKQFRIIANESSTSRLVRIDDTPGQIVLNELMFADQGSGEWMEWFNNFNADCSLEIQLINGNDTANAGLVLKADQYLLMVEDSASMILNYPEILTNQCRIVEVDPWLSLNNYKDSLVITDLYKTVIDELSYEVSSWDQGISMERVNSMITSNNPQNWGKSVDPRGATPGQINSITVTANTSRGTVTVDPNPFSPDQDGVDERCLITVDLDFYPQRLDVNIFDVTGHKIKTLHQGQGRQNQVLIWDGTDNNYQLMPPGIYIIFINAESDDCSFQTKLTVVLAEKLN